MARLRSPAAFVAAARGISLDVGKQRRRRASGKGLLPRRRRRRSLGGALSRRRACGRAAVAAGSARSAAAVAARRRCRRTRRAPRGHHHHHHHHHRAHHRHRGDTRSSRVVRRTTTKWIIYLCRRIPGRRRRAVRATGSVHRGRSAASSSPEATSDVAPERRALPHLVARTVLGPAPRREARGGAGGGGGGAVAVAGPAVLVVGGAAVVAVVPVDPRRVRHADDVRAAAGREAMAADQREDRVAQLRAAEGCAVKRAAARCAQRRSRVGRGARTRRASFAAWGGRVVVVCFCWSPHARVAASAAAEADGRRATPTHPIGRRVRICIREEARQKQDATTDATHAP